MKGREAVNAIQNIAEKLTPYAEKKYGTFSSESRTRILKYGITKLFHISLGIIWLYIIAWILDMRLIVFINTMSFILIKRSFGGYHAKTPVRCLFLSTLLTIGSSWIALKININFSYIILIYIFSWVSAICIGVKDNPNKKFKYTNKRITPDLADIFYKQGIVILMLLNIINISLYALNIQVLSNAIVLGVLFGILNLYINK